MGQRNAGVIGVGYEGMAAGEFIELLRAADVGVVADVRLNPMSRKTGFSKRSLAELLIEADIHYVHFPALGNPRWNRDGFAERFSAAAIAAREAYRQLLRTDEAQHALEQIAQFGFEHTIALLCVESDERYCHRELIVDRHIRPRHVRELQVEPHPGWTHEQQQKMERYAAQDSLFGEQAHSVLEAPRFDVRYHYVCGRAECGGHKQSILDWELVALQRRLRDLPDANAAAAIRERFFTTMCAPQRAVVFFVGNQAKRHHVFSVLGIFYPPKAEMDQMTLWDQP